MEHLRMMRADYALNWGRLTDLDFEEVAKLKRERYRTNLEWLPASLGTGSEGGGHIVTFDTPHFTKSPLLGDTDLLREYLPHAEKHGIQVIAYTNLHWYSYAFAEDHPDWEQLLQDGRPYGRVNPLYGDGTTMCVNGPWRDWAFLLLKEAMQTGIKGVFLDGPAIFPGACYCTHCKQLFKEQTGEELPTWGDWEDPVWAAFVEFRADSMARFLKDARAAVTEVLQDGIVFINAGAWPSWEIPRDVTRLSDHQDISGAEAFFHLNRTTEPYFQLRVGKYLRASRKPSVVFVHHCQGIWHYLPLQSDELRLALAQTLASGSHTWIALINGEDLERPCAWESANDVLRVPDEHPEAFEDLQPVADVGILVSSDTAFFYRSAEKGLYGQVTTASEEDLIATEGEVRKLSQLSEQKAASDRMAREEVFGFFNLLTHQRIPFQFILAKHLREEIQGLDVLILPNQACLADEEKRIIKDFVHSGGKLLATLESGRYDEKGQLEEDFFREVLGVNRIEGVFPLEVREEYLRFKEEFGEFEAGELVPRPTYVLKTVPDGNVETPAVFLNPTGQFYVPLKGESPYPAFWIKEYGKGKVAYLPALYGAFYGEYKEGNVERMVSGLVRMLLDKQPTVWIEGPASVIYETYRKGDRWLVHLVNVGGDLQRPLSLVPASGVKVHFRAQMLSVRSLSTGEEFVLHSDGTETCVEVPSIEVYEVLEAE